MKTCTKCGVEKDESEYTKDKSKKDGLRPSCKKCKSIYSKEYRNNNADLIKQRDLNYRNSNKESIKIRKKAYQINNKFKIATYHKKWYNNNLEKANNRARIWQINNKDSRYKHNIIYKLKKQIGETPPPELVEVKLLINKTKRLCKTLKN